MSRLRIRPLLLALLVASVAGGTLAAPAGAEGLPAGAEWRLEQPPPPSPPAGLEEGESLGLPVGLGAIGDIEFWAPNRGALITAGNGNTVKPSVWAYNGEAWHELTAQTAEGVCGAADGRIAWAGPDEFWTVSNGRPGQAPESKGVLPPLVDNTLCHFAVGAGGEFEIVASYAQLAFESTSYQAMHAAACVSATDCWFGGGPLPEPGIGSFQLHWNGHAVVPEPYLNEGHTVEDMRAFEGDVFTSVRLSKTDRSIKHPLEIPALHVISGEAAGEGILGLDGELYGPREDPFALDYLRLSASEDALWAAAGSEPQPPEGKGREPAGVTVLRYSRLQYSPVSEEYEEEPAPGWRQVLGPATKPSGRELFPEELVTSIAAEPQTNDVWIALQPQEEAAGQSSPIAHATLALVSADGSVLDELELPAAKGVAAHIACPAVHDCWAATTAGWLFHLATAPEREHPQPDGDPAFSGDYVIVYRPPDAGVPQQESYVLPVDDSGLGESQPVAKAPAEPPAQEQFARVSLPLLSHERTRLRHGTELELSFRLAVKARVRLLAKRHRSVVASTPTRTLRAGNRSLLLHLSIKRWPTKLDLQTHPLAPLPTTSTRENTSATDTVSY